MAKVKLYWDKIKGSSNISKTTWVYEPDPQADGGHMYVVFNSGWMYVFYEIPSELYDNFIDSPSKGKFFHEHIRDKYDYDRLGEV